MRIFLEWVDGVGLAPTQINVGAGLICASGSSTVRESGDIVALPAGFMKGGLPFGKTERAFL